jgi:hypothetical protein
MEKVEDGGVGMCGVWEREGEGWIEEDEEQEVVAEEDRTGWAK